MQKESSSNINQESLNDIMKRSVNDQLFRELCLANGNAAFKEVTGCEVSSHTEIYFIESGDSKQTYTFVLPEFIGDCEELTEEELEYVSGGATCSHCDGKRGDCSRLTSCNDYDNGILRF